MRHVNLGGVRGKTALVALAGTFLAAVAIVAIVALCAQAIVRAMVADTLSDRLDKAQAALEAGNPQAALLFAGNDVLQITDEQGNIIASSANAQGLPALIDLLGDDDSRLLDDDDLDDDSDDDDERKPTASSSDASSASGPKQSSGSSGAVSGTKTGSSTSARAGESDSDDDDDDEEDDDSASSKSAPSSAKKKGSKAKSSAVKEAGSKADSDDDSDGREDADDDSDDDDAEEDDSDDDSDDDEKPSQKGKASSMLPIARPLLWANAFFSVPVAHAQSAADASEQPPAHDRLHLDSSTAFGGQGPYLVMKRQVVTGQETMTITAMASLANALKALQAAIQLLVVVLVVVLLLTVAFAWKLAGRTLRPVEQMRASVEAIEATDLSARIEVPEQDKDLAPLARTFNDMLDRVEASVNEQKRFVSDASHELKSPVAASGIILEMMSEHPDSVDFDQALKDLNAENERMKNMVADLLTLARHDEGRSRVEVSPVDLLDVVIEQTAALRNRPDLELDLSAAEPVVCKADAELLGHAIRNLLDNAAHYAEKTVKVACFEHDGHAVVTISDDGPGIAAEDRDRVFDRFVRLEGGRDRRKGSTGLGLAVAKTTIEQQGGSICFTEPEIGGATARIVIASA